MTSILPITLTGKFVQLEPLSQEHHDGLVAAVADGEMWNIWYTSIPTPQGMAAEIDRRLALQEQGAMLPFTARRLSDGKIIGMTTYMNIDVSVPRVEIGSTWNSASVHGTGTGNNPDSKLLLLQHAFETLQCNSVEFRTSWHNHQSRAAIARLGAKQDGVLRNQSKVNGMLRDTVVFSILPNEWESVKLGLEYRITKQR
ncbi:GNAT family N-acetyltransferase [Renibacterium salmoninarum]|nr:GNAT family protein [Renibacterium salmoninarum]